MPSPAPLTVIEDDGEFIVCRDENIYVASFRHAADARAFVALPALEKAANRALEWMRLDELGEVGQEIADELYAALAQADGPSPKE